MKEKNRQGILPFRVLDKVAEYGYEGLMPHEKISLALELIGFEGKVPYTSLCELFDATDEKLLGYGMKDGHIAALRTINKLSGFYLKETMQRNSLNSLDNPVKVADYVRFALSGMPSRENFLCLFMDIKFKLIDSKIIARGTVDEAAVYPREIIKEALRLDAVNIFLAHNHPSGNPEPSGGDIHLTASIKDAASLVGICVVDHIVVGKEGYFSFREKNLMENETREKIRGKARGKIEDTHTEGVKP